MRPSRIIGRTRLDTLKPVLALFKKKNVNPNTAGVKKQGASTYENGNKVLTNCGAFTLTAEQGNVTYLIKAGATITFFKAPTYNGPDTLCLIEDCADNRAFTVTGHLGCKIKDTRPDVPPAPLPLFRTLSI